MVLGIALGLACLLPVLALAPWTPAADLPPERAMAFMVQANCLDADQRPRPGVLPFQPECGERRAALEEGGEMAWRKYDWPAQPLREDLPRGYQASDAYRTTILGLPAAVQTFDYGTPPYTFGQWDQGTDGGDGVVLEPDRLSIALTEDPVGGAQWWNSDRCDGRLPIKPGWLLYQAGRAEAVAPNALTPAPTQCPRGRTLSLTRWHVAPMALPWLLRGAPQGRFPAEVLVSEHYTHPEARRSNAMERFLFARDLGKVRWERWENLAFPAGRPDREAVLRDQATLGAAATCPELDGLRHPDAGGGQWVMTFCRMWTNFDPAPPGVLFPLLPWPVAQRNR